MAQSPTYADVERAREARDVGSLIDILDRAPTPFRVAAARHLGELGARRAENSLVRGLRSPDVILKVACVKALGAIGDPNAAEAISSLAAQDDQLVVQTTAAIALLQMKDSRAVDVLIRIALRNELTARHSRRWAVRELANLRSPIEDSLVERIVDSLSLIDKVRLRKEVAILRGTG